MKEMDIDKLRSIRDMANSLINVHKSIESASIKAQLRVGMKVKLPPDPRPKKYANLIGFVKEVRLKKASIRISPDDNGGLPNHQKAFRKSFGKEFTLDVPFGMITIVED